MNIVEKKSAMRKLAKQRRAALHKELPYAGNELLNNFHFAIEGDCVVASYLPMQNEIDSTPLMKELRSLGAKLCLPRINKVTNSLNFHLYEINDALDKGEFGVLEPKYDAKIVVPNIMLVPLLAFDEKGFRLGYGGGYYDKAIASAKNSGELTTIGLAYSGQKVDNLPIEAHDIPLDYIITEAEIFDFQPE